MKLFGKEINFFKKKQEEERKRAAVLGRFLDFASKEAYNLLRTNILFSIADKQGKGKVIGITSSIPHEGKSYTAINLAYSLAKEGHKTLLISADMRKPSIENTIGIKPKFGLSSILVGEEGDAVIPSGLHDNFMLLPAGIIPPNPSELLGTERMKDLLDKCAEEYPYVIVDLPPVNVVADALVVSKFLDGVVVIVRHGMTRRKELVEAIKKLKYVQAHILGVVYNGYNHGRGKNYKGSYYKKYGYKNHYSSYYYKDSKENKNKENK